MRLGGKWGLLDYSLTERVSPRYDVAPVPMQVSETEATPFLLVRKDSLYGLLNAVSFKEVLAPQFDEISQLQGEIFFQNQIWSGKGDFFANVRKGEKFGIINAAAQIVVPARYDAKPLIMDDFCIVEQDGKKGIMDVLGREILPAQYHHIDVNEYEQTGAVLVKEHENDAAVRIRVTDGKRMEGAKARTEKQASLLSHSRVHAHTSNDAKTMAGY